MKAGETEVSAVMDDLHALIDRWRGAHMTSKEAAEELVFYMGIRSDTVSADGKAYIDRLKGS